jgi:hypothetical protein
MFLGHAPTDHPIDHRFDDGGGDALTLEAAVASSVMIHAQVGRCGKRSGLTSPQSSFHF